MYKKDKTSLENVTRDAGGKLYMYMYKCEELATKGESLQNNGIDFIDENNNVIVQN